MKCSVESSSSLTALSNSSQFLQFNAAVGVLCDINDLLRYLVVDVSYDSGFSIPNRFRFLVFACSLQPSP